MVMTAEKKKTVTLIAVLTGLQIGMRLGADARLVPEVLIAIGETLRDHPESWAENATEEDREKSFAAIEKRLGLMKLAVKEQEIEDAKHTDSAQSEVSE